MALQQLAEALAIADETGNLHDRGTYLATLSDTYSAIGDREKAIDLMTNTLHILNKSDLQPQIRHEELSTV